MDPKKLTDTAQYVQHSQKSVSAFAMRTAIKSKSGPPSLQLF